MAKLNLVVLVGGKSPEHNISLISGYSVVNALNKEKYNILVVGIDKTGQWWLQDTEHFSDHRDDPQRIVLSKSDTRVVLSQYRNKPYLMQHNGNTKIAKVDFVFPVLHGANGEDGVMQGVFRANNVAFAGVDLMASAIGMDKDVSKRLWRDAGIPIADFVVADLSNRKQLRYRSIVKKLGSPLFVKPANAGSSVGVHKVSDKEAFTTALEDAFKYDRKVLIEEAIQGIEVECAVLGNENPQASVVGAIIPTETFYSYEAKYISSTGAKLMIPADIPDEVSELIRQTAIRAFKAIGGEGLSRVDFFLRPDNSIVLNEINTLPGFTSISMYPKLWEASGVNYTDLLDSIVQLGLKRYRQLQKLMI